MEGGTGHPAAGGDWHAAQSRAQAALDPAPAAATWPGICNPAPRAGPPPAAASRPRRSAAHRRATLHAAAGANAPPAASPALTPDHPPLLPAPRRTGRRRTSRRRCRPSQRSRRRSLPRRCLRTRTRSPSRCRQRSTASSRRWVNVMVLQLRAEVCTYRTQVMKKAMIYSRKSHASSQPQPTHHAATLPTNF